MKIDELAEGVETCSAITKHIDSEALRFHHKHIYVYNSININSIYMFMGLTKYCPTDEISE